MQMITRRRFSDNFKATVALEALRGDRTVQEIASKHRLNPTQVTTWKRQAIDALAVPEAGGALYLHKLTDGIMAERVIIEWITFHNTDRPHTALDTRTPDEACFDGKELKKAG